MGMGTLIAIVSIGLQLMLFCASVRYSYLLDEESHLSIWKDEVDAFFVLTMEGISVTILPSLLLTVFHLMITDIGAPYVVFATLVILVSGIKLFFRYREQCYGELSLSGIREFAKWRYSFFTKR